MASEYEHGACNGNGNSATALMAINDFFLALNTPQVACYSEESETKVLLRLTGE
jgi:hypothetical protein